MIREDSFPRNVPSLAQSPFTLNVWDSECIPATKRTKTKSKWPLALNLEKRRERRWNATPLTLFKANFPPLAQCQTRRRSSRTSKASNRQNKNPERVSHKKKHLARSLNGKKDSSESLSHPFGSTFSSSLFSLPGRGMAHAQLPARSRSAFARSWLQHKCLWGSVANRELPSALRPWTHKSELILTPWSKDPRAGASCRRWLWAWSCGVGAWSRTPPAGRCCCPRSPQTGPGSRPRSPASGTLSLRASPASERTKHDEKKRANRGLASRPQKRLQAIVSAEANSPTQR